MQEPRTRAATIKFASYIYPELDGFDHIMYELYFLSSKPYWFLDKLPIKPYL